MTTYMLAVLEYWILQAKALSIISDAMLLRMWVANVILIVSVDLIRESVQNEYSFIPVRPILPLQ
jgi:hypothetical protein